ncbi:MAG: hypothetical protein AAFP03_09095 [Cyanobacteria bacterium J06598_3]
MYFGGERITLDDVRLDKFSCHELGLVCTVCKEPVRRRKGNVNIPHFAHFPTIDPKKKEECERRRSVPGGGSSPDPDWYLDEGQRLKLFHQHFLSIVKRSIPDLDIDAIDFQKRGNAVYEPIQLKSLNLLTRGKGDFEKHMRTASGETTELEIKIACEALTYITVASSRAIFMLISEHLILHSRGFSYSIHDSRFPRELCFKIASLLASVDWTESFTRLSGMRPPQIQEKRKSKVNVSIVSLPGELFERIEEGNNLVLYLVKEKMFLGMPDSLCKGKRQLIGFVKLNELLLHRIALKENAEKIRGISSSIKIYRRHHRFS